MPTNFPVPGPTGLKSILDGLAGKPVTVKRGTAADPTQEAPAALADYVTDDERLAVLCLADLRLANALGAALTMVPATAVEEASKQGRIDDATLDNYREIANILARLFNSDDTAHLRFRQVCRVPSELPDEVTQLLGQPRARRDYQVEVAEYGTGTLSLLVG